MRVEAVAEEWGISKRTVYRLIKRGLVVAEIITDQIPTKRFDIPASFVSKVSSEADKIAFSASPACRIRKCLTQIKEGQGIKVVSK
jgi:predicted DNA-binding transcriptional regulator AlpA